LVPQVDFRRVNPHYNPVLYAIGKAVQAIAFNTIWRRKVSGRENVPPFGTPVIFAANHRSLSDPSNVGAALPYPIFYFAKEELFNIPVLGWWLRCVNSFPVRRKEHDVGAFKTAMEVLEIGGGLMFFPEGGRRLDPKRQWQAKAGIGMLACKTGAQIIPVGILGGDRFSKLGALDVRFGKPIFPPSDPKPEDYQRLTDQVIQRIKALCEL
jgi:1-acyl-sn-glycerol-3-phosphate acyltransferase